MTITADYPTPARQAAYDPQRPVPERPAWVFLGLILVGAVLLGVGWTTWDVVDRQSVTDEARFAAVGSVDLRELGSSPVTVVGSDRTDALLTRTVSWRGSGQPARTERVEAGTLVVESACAGLGGCNAGYQLQIPRAATVRATLSSGDLDVRAVAGVWARASSGDVEAQDVAGPVTAETSSGTIAVCRVAGEVTLRTTSGGIDGCDLGGARATLETSSGSLTASFRGPIERIDARSTSGSVRLTVPDAAYDVRSTTRSGSQDIRVRTDIGAAGKIAVTTTSGSIRVAS